MLRSTTAWAAVGAVAVLMLSGCRFFGIDNRPDIRYVTESQRKEVSEPMYSMPVPGTGLFKQWPMRLGPEYGYAPWERRPSGVRPAVDGTAAAGPPMTGSANASSSASPNGVAIAASSDAADSTKPSSRATPRLPGGELATAATVAPEAVGSGSATAGEPTHLVADDFDVPVAARGALDFRTPAVARGEAAVSAPATSALVTSAPARAAASMVARAPAATTATRPPLEADLPWRATGDEAEVTAAANDAAGSAMPSGSGVSLQQPGVFSARKVVAAAAPQAETRTATTSPRNVLRDEAVRPASAEMPVSLGKATLPNTISPTNGAPPSSARGAAAARVPRELVPPGDFGYDGDLGGEFGGDARAVRGAPASDASRATMGGAASREAAAEEVYASPYARQPVAAPRSAAGVEMVGTPRSEPGPRVVRPAVEVDDEEPVFVTATDMSDEDVPVAREYANPYYRPSDAAPGNVAGDAGRAGSGAAGGGVLGELEAVKQSILR